MNIRFEKATSEHQKLIFEWLEEPHVKEFWDNSQEHKDDIINFINGRKEPSKYFYGTTMYWVGYVDDDPFSFLLSDILQPEQTDLSDLHRAYLSKTGHTISLDFCIGNLKFLGKGFAAPALNAFVEFYYEQVDPKADTFFIDPDDNNPRAKHVYAKAGFELMGDFKAKKAYWNFSGDKTYLMVRKLM